MSDDALQGLLIYKWNGLWVFDDPGFGLIHEPFILGADTMIDMAVAMTAIPKAEEGFLLLFSDKTFIGSQMVLTHMGPEGDGNLYEWRNTVGFLCPALLHYFGTAPGRIFAAVRPLEKGGGS